MNPETVTRSQIILRGLLCRCPNCGGRKLFVHWLRLRPRCVHCGFKLTRSEGFFLGAMVWNYGLTVFGVLPFIIAATLAGWLSVDMCIGACISAGIFMPAITYPWAWSLWLMSYYYILPHELPANETELIPTDEDE